MEKRPFREPFKVRKRFGQFKRRDRLRENGFEDALGLTPENTISADRSDGSFEVVFDMVVRINPAPCPVEVVPKPAVIHSSDSVSAKVMDQSKMTDSVIHRILLLVDCFFSVCKEGVMRLRFV